MSDLERPYTLNRYRSVLGILRDALRDAEKARDNVAKCTDYAREIRHALTEDAKMLSECEAIEKKIGIRP